MGGGLQESPPWVAEVTAMLLRTMYVFLQIAKNRAIPGNVGGIRLLAETWDCTKGSAGLERVVVCMAKAVSYSIKKAW